MTVITDRTPWDRFVSSLLLFKFLIPEDQQTLWSLGEVLSFGNGELIVEEHDLSPFFYIVLEGTVNVHVAQDDSQVYICSLGAGTSFGEASLFSKMKRTASVSALDDVIVFKLSRSEVIDFIKKRPSAGNRILLVFVNGLLLKLREANRELAYERRSDGDQADVDALLAEFTGKTSQPQL